jgi:NADPH:quinone reductase-like Zn-dependent oxidoreductase
LWIATHLLRSSREISLRAVRLTSYSNPLEGLKCVEIAAPEAPGPHQVLIGVEFSPLNQSDLLLARGLYGVRPAFPTVIGNDGVGRVLSI